MASSVTLKFSVGASTLVEANAEARRIAEAFFDPVAAHEVVAVEARGAGVDHVVRRADGGITSATFDVDYIARCLNEDDLEPF